MKTVLEGARCAVRRASEGDVEFLLGLAEHADVEPFLGRNAPRDRAAIAAEVERSHTVPGEYGRFVIEADGVPAGTLGFEQANARSRIAQLERLSVEPRFRGRGLAGEAARLLCRHLLLELGYHRLQLEIYGFNDRAQRHVERIGFLREGVKRKAYWRHGDWADSVMYALLQDEVDRLDTAGHDAPGAA